MSDLWNWIVSQWHHPTPPPDWLQRVDETVLRRAAEWTYLILISSHVAVYAILLWQRRNPETTVASRMRWFVAMSGAIWIVLWGYGKVTLAWLAWLRFGLVLVTVGTIAVCGSLLWAMVTTYVVPSFRHDRAVVPPLPGNEAVVPERRTGRDRRTGWGRIADKGR